MLTIKTIFNSTNYYVILTWGGILVNLGVYFDLFYRYLTVAHSKIV